ncbi:MAG: MaoC family dehydratase [Pseudomonadota bacterium]
MRFAELTLGQSDFFEKTVTEADIVAFAGVSGDTNPVHLSQDYAQQTQFKTRIAHGMLGASFLSAVFGTKLPGPGCIYLSQTLKFKAPVKIGDTVRASVRVAELLEDKKFVRFDCTCSVGDTVVTEGEALVLVPD